MILMAFRFHWEFGYLSRHFDERYPFTCMKAFLNIEYFFESTVFHVFFNSTVFHVSFNYTVFHVFFNSTVFHVFFNSTVFHVFFNSTVFHVFFNSTVFHVFRGNLQLVWTMTILYPWQYLKKRLY